MLYCIAFFYIVIMLFTSTFHLIISFLIESSLLIIYLIILKITNNNKAYFPNYFIYRLFIIVCNLLVCFYIIIYIMYTELYMNYHNKIFGLNQTLITIYNIVNYVI